MQDMVIRSFKDPAYPSPVLHIAKTKPCIQLQKVCIKLQTTITWLISAPTFFTVGRHL